MKNTPFRKNLRSAQFREQQLARMRQVIHKELTPLQRQALSEYYFQRKSLTQIARERNVNKSTVCRTLHRAEEKLRRFLNY